MKYSAPPPIHVSRGRVKFDFNEIPAHAIINSSAKINVTTTKPNQMKIALKPIF